MRDHLTALPHAVLPEQIRQSNIDVAKELPENLSEIVGILSLTESPDDLLMWTYYAGGHTGFVVEFDSQNAFFANENRLGVTTARKVEYSQTVPLPYLMDNDKIAQERIVNMFYVKNLRFQHEREWRMVAGLDMSDNQKMLKDKTKIFLYHFDPTAVTGVIFGARMSEENRAKILAIVSQDRYKHVSVSQAVPINGEIVIESFEGI